jgi:hypothetical protein
VRLDGPIEPVDQLQPTEEPDAARRPALGDHPSSTVRTRQAGPVGQVRVAEALANETDNLSLARGQSGGGPVDAIDLRWIGPLVGHVEGSSA